jgi:hypothetical protein
MIKMCLYPGGAQCCAGMAMRALFAANLAFGTAQMGFERMHEIVHLQARPPLLIAGCNAETPAAAEACHPPVRSEACGKWM